MSKSSPLHELISWLDTTLRVGEIPDDPNALNGLQVEACERVGRVALAVDASEKTIDQACALKADLLLVHHGLYWGGNRPMVGVLGRKIRKAFAGGLSIYSAHLPLDLHPTLGNNVGLAQALELKLESPWGRFNGIDIGFATRAIAGRRTPEQLLARITQVVGPCRRFGRGPDSLDRIAIVSGGGASALRQAAREGFDALVTGEGPHHAAIDADELGIHLFLAGHYRTEVFGVRALGERLSQQYAIPATFIEADTGL